MYRPSCSVVSAQAPWCNTAAGFTPGAPRPTKAAELGAVHVVGDLTVAQVAKLVSLGQIVNGQDIPYPALVERADQVASDESSSSRNDIHDQNILE